MSEGRKTLAVLIPEKGGRKGGASLGGKFPQRRKSGKRRERETDRGTLKQIEGQRGPLTHSRCQKTESEHRGSPLFSAAGLDGDIAQYRLLSLVWAT